MKLQRFASAAMIDGDVWCNALDVERLEGYCDDLILKADAAHKDAAYVREGLATVQSVVILLTKENEELKSKAYEKRCALAEIREQIRIAHIACDMLKGTIEQDEWLLQFNRLMALLVSERELMANP